MRVVRRGEVDPLGAQRLLALVVTAFVDVESSLFGIDGCSGRAGRGFGDLVQVAERVGVVASQGIGVEQQWSDQPVRSPVG